MTIVNICEQKNTDVFKIGSMFIDRTGSLHILVYQTTEANTNYNFTLLNMSDWTTDGLFINDNHRVIGIRSEEFYNTFGDDLKPVKSVNISYEL